MISPRPYQAEAMDALHAGLQVKDVLLLQAATGAGKTFIITRMIQRYFFDHPDRSFLIVMHKKELISQFLAAFKRFTTVPSSEIGVCCAGLGRKELKCRITIATIQTLVNNLGSYPGADMVVIDETHRAGYEGESQYNTMLTTLREYKPNHKLIGLTATANRLGHGYIYGDKCKPGRVNIFPELTHRITYQRLKSEGYLMPLTGYVADGNAAKDLESVDLLSGEYNIGQAGKVMTRYLSAAVDAVEKYATEHKHIAIFACTISHCEALHYEFLARGHSSVPIHSKLTTADREKNIAAWQEGKARVAVSVQILAEGFDFPALSCLVFCRPTHSAVLYVQAIGRILRMSEGKDEALLIDLTGNVLEFGLDLDNPKFEVPRGSGSGEAPTKICPFVYPDGRICGERVHTATRFCPSCEFEWTVEEVEAALPELKKVSFGAPVEAPLWHKVSYMSIGIHQNQETGKRLLRLQFECPGENVYDKNIFVSDWLCFQDWYTGWAIDKGKEKWALFSDMDYPETVELGDWYAKESFATPEQVLLKKDGKWHRILDYKFEEEEEFQIKNSVLDDQPFDGDLPF